LRAAKVAANDLIGARKVLDSSRDRDGSKSLISSASIAFKEGAYDEAFSGYSAALDKLGFRPDLAYNQALCLYRMKQHDQALEKILGLISRGLEKYPELMEMTSDSFSMNQNQPYSTAQLRATYLVEACNLKAAIEFDVGNVAAAAATLSQMLPYRSEQDLDAVTLHNQAVIVDVGEDATFRKLQFLLSNPPFPPETFANILLLYLRHGYEDLASDLLADDTQMTYDLLSQELCQYVDAFLLATTSPDDALTAFDALSRQILQRIHKGVKVVSEAEASGNANAITAANADLRHAMNELAPVLLSMGKIHWEASDYQAVESLLRKSGEYCGDGNACAISLGHAYFMQNKFREAALCYEPLVSDDAAILDIPPIVLANLCASYVLTDRNETAEEIMALVEKAEDAAASSVNDDCNNGRLLHGAIINLVIGTLYCQRGGVDLICKGFVPYEQRLCPDTWFHAKRCLLALQEQLAKHMITIADESVTEIFAFLDHVDRHGKKISSTAADDEYSYMPSEGDNTIAAEARELKLLLLLSLS